jgi:uncharacterized protein (TIGR02453 family)
MSGSFQGFGPRALPFFKALDFHQDKAWFEDNRAIYEAEVLGPLGALILDLAEACAERGIPLRGTPKGSIFRIHRDVRFSKDKRPYKTHAGAVMTRTGNKSDPGLFYVHVAPTGSFVAAGVYHPEPDRLRALRAAMCDKPARFSAMENSLAAKDLSLDPDFALKRPPREAASVDDPALVRALKFTSLVTRRPIDPDLVERPSLLEHCLAFIADARPLLDFAWSVLDRAPPARKAGESA